MKTRTKTFFTFGLIASFLAVFLLPALLSLSGADIIGAEQVQAQNTTGSYEFLEPIPGVGDEIDVDNEFSSFVQTVITMVIGFTILAAVIMIVIAGFQYLTSVSQDKTSDAKKTISNAVLGLVLALASVVILQTINPQLIELKSVDTVTTSGSAFVIAPNVTGFGGTAINEEGDWRQQAANNFCWRLEGEFWTVSGDRDQDLQICHQTESACNESRDAALEEYGDGWDGVDSQCLYYYESVGQLVQIGDEEGEPLETEKILENNIVGIDTNKSEAKRICENNARKIAVEGDALYEEQCKLSSLPALDPDKCEARCDEPSEIPEQGVDGASSHILPLENGSFEQYNSLAACEAKAGESGGCYAATPENILENNIINPQINPEDSVREKLFAPQSVTLENGTTGYLPQISINNSSCTSVGQSGCTNVGGLSNDVISDIRRLNEEVNNTEECLQEEAGIEDESCSLVITGGTEWWSHGNREEDPYLQKEATAHHPEGLGPKTGPDRVRTGAVDFRIKENIANYVKENSLVSTDEITAGSTYYVDGGSTLFLREDTHWHVGF